MEGDSLILSYDGLRGGFWPVFGYGCRRGSALGGKDREVDLERAVASVETLFDEDAVLIHAKTWLQNLRLGAEESEYKKSVFTTVVRVLCDLLPGVESLRVDSSGVFVKGKKFGPDEIPLSVLSDGYLTTTGWMLDMIARWLYMAEKDGVSIDSEFPLQMTGLVLIDELDLHLHPRWQRTIIADLRKTFPKMSFVATTHNPLTLLGAREGEIYVLREEAPEQTNHPKIQAQQIDLPRGLRADQVLTGEWFGLASTLDDETLAMMEKYKELLLLHDEALEEKQKDLRIKLRQRLNGFAETSVERMAMQIDAEIAEEEQRKYEELSPQEREKRRERIKQMVQARMAKRKQAESP